MQQAPMQAALPLNVIEAPDFARISFSNLEGNRYYLVESRRIVRTPDGNIDLIVKKSNLVFTDTTLPNWKTADKVKFRMSAGRAYNKIDPADNAIINPEIFEERYPDAELPWAYYRLPDALNQNGELMSDLWSDIEPIQQGLFSYEAEVDVVDADLHADHVWAFYSIVHHGGKRRRRTRRIRNRKHRTSRRRKQ
jgi:hypothetical protein